jgi:hypothetical protein
LAGVFYLNLNHKLNLPECRNAAHQDAEEEEYLENLFDALCCCIMLPENRAAFVAAEVGGWGGRG